MGAVWDFYESSLYIRSCPPIFPRGVALFSTWPYFQLPITRHWRPLVYILIYMAMSILDGWQRRVVLRNCFPRRLNLIASKKSDQLPRGYHEFNIDHYCCEGEPCQMVWVLILRSLNLFWCLDWRFDVGAHDPYPRGGLKSEVALDDRSIWSGFSVKVEMPHPKSGPAS